MTEMLRTILPVVLMLLIGILCRKKQIITREGIDALKSVVVSIALPAVLLNAFATTQYTLMDILIPLFMFLICLAGWGCGQLAARLSEGHARFVPFLTTGFEAGMLGYALFNMLYGAQRTAEFARIDLGQVLFVFTLYKILLGFNTRQKTSARQLVREMVFSPIILSIAAGVLLGATGLYELMKPSGLSGVFDACTAFISAPTSALILLVIGYDLVLNDIPWKETLRVVAARLVLMLVLRTVLLWVLGILWPAVDLTNAVNVMFILPPPFVLTVFADDAEERTFISSVLSVSTLTAILGFAVMAILGAAG